MKSIIILVLLSYCLLSFAQNADNRVIWSSDLKLTRCLIENKGQFPDIDGEKVLFGYIADKEKYFLTEKGLIIRIDTVMIKKSPLRVFSNLFKSEEEREEEERENIQYVHNYIKSTWKNANKSGVSIITQEKVDEYFTFLEAKEECYGYKRIIYKNIYNKRPLQGTHLLTA